MENKEFDAHSRHKIYEAKMADHKKEVFAETNLPIEFVQFIESLAYDRGHSAGAGEVDSIACSLANEFAPYFEQYKSRMGMITR